MKHVDTYIAGLSSPQKEITTQLRNILLSDFPQLTEEFKWSQPSYMLNGKDVCYFVSTKQGVNFGLVKGAHFKDPKNLLEGTGKDMRHIKIKNVDEIDTEYIKELINQALQ